MKKIHEKLSKFHIEEFNPEVYKKINLDSLLVYGICTLQKKKLPITEENIYVQTYILFPYRYSLPSFIFFPNAARLNKSWLRCRSDKSFITGKSSLGFNLTKLGYNEARKVEDILKSTFIQDSKTDDKRVLGERAVIQKFKEQNSFNEFLKANKIILSEIEFCLLVNTRQTASHTIFNTRFAELNNIFEENNELELLDFLNKLKNKFYYFFTSSKERASMMKPKKK